VDLADLEMTKPSVPLLPHDAGCKRSFARSRCLLVGMAFVAACLLPSSASGQSFQTIESSGPLNRIHLGDNLSCQVERDSAQQFFGGVPGDCGTFVQSRSLSLLSQSQVNGSGTEADPYKVETQVDAQDPFQGPTGLRLTQIDTYVVGRDFYRTDVTIENLGGTSQSVLLYHAADCYLQGSDSGYGYHDVATGGVYCAENPHNSPPGAIEGFEPLDSGNSWYEGDYTGAFSPGPSGFPNTCECETFTDNGVGIAWNVSGGPGSTETHSFLTRITGEVEPAPPPPSAPPLVQNAQAAPQTVDDLPKPGFASSVNVQELSGQVLVGVRGAAAVAGRARASQKGIKFVPLSEARQIPVGSFLDTRRGSVRLQSARGRRGTRQNGDFSAGLFQVLQSRRGKGLTDVALKGASFASCRRAGRGKRASAAGSIRRRLRSSARGRFRTRGRHSAATVRGTAWLTADRCDGTLTKVTRGKVAVRDFRRRKTVIVRAGKSYLARAR
jgi:hypothetical protein